MGLYYTIVTIGGGLFMTSESALPQVVMEERHFMTRVFSWIRAGLAHTGGVAAFVATTPALAHLVGAELAWCFWAHHLSAVSRLSPGERGPIDHVRFLGDRDVSVLCGAQRADPLGHFSGLHEQLNSDGFFVTAGTFGIMKSLRLSHQDGISLAWDICALWRSFISILASTREHVVPKSDR